MPNERLTSMHATAVNLARRYTEQNENDLMQENMFDEPMTPKQDYNHGYCKELAAHLIHLKSLPVQCYQFKDVTSDLKRRDTDTTEPSAFLS